MTPDPRAVPAAHSMDTAWFGVDADGNLAIFDTGEGGALPDGAYTPSCYGPDASEAARGFAGVCRAIGAEALHWAGEDVPRWPTFVYEDEDVNWLAAPYVRKHVPRRPARIEEVPPELRAGIARLPVRFEDPAPIQPMEHVPCSSAAPLWLSSDGRVARPFYAGDDDDGRLATLTKHGIRFEPVPPVEDDAE